MCRVRDSENISSDWRMVVFHLYRFFHFQIRVLRMETLKCCGREGAVSNSVSGSECAGVHNHYNLATVLDGLEEARAAVLLKRAMNLYLIYFMLMVASPVLEYK